MVSSWWLCIVHHWSRSNVCGFRPFFYEVYTGLVLFAIGSETSGSITYAAFRCGVMALQPTFGAVGRSGVMSIAESLDKLGPFCRNSADCVIVLVFWISFGGRTQMMFHPETFPSQILLQLTEDADICYDRIKDIPCITCPNKPEESMFVMVKPSFEPSQRHQR